MTEILKNYHYCECMCFIAVEVDACQAIESIKQFNILLVVLDFQIRLTLLTVVPDSDLRFEL